ncbi:MAG: potassium transporter TrkA [Methanomassiliicoccales archaeon]|nr:potassium transporter TrkA [Methanomassiliicoccales archaeon]MDD1756644.1 potassium transporter TrkA [Methanomassiliicoccales archaeon]
MESHLGPEEGKEKVPRTVREILTEMKDTSEVIVDLAYAALVFDSQDMAEEVQHIERRMDTLLYNIRIKAMLSARTKRDAEQLAGLLQVASSAEAISNAAGDIVNLLRYDSDKRPFLPIVLKEAEEKIKSLNLADGSDMVNRTIEDLGVESETGMRIIALKRGKRWIYDPETNNKLKAGDILIVRGTENGFEVLRAFATGERRWPQYPVREGA